MEKDIRANKFIEHAYVHGNLYGTSLAAVESVTKTGKICILEIDVQGAQNIHNMQLFPPPNFVFIFPPDSHTLEIRLRARGTDSEEAIKLRMKNADDEMSKGRSSGLYAHTIVNNSLHQSYALFRAKLFHLYPHLEHYATNNRTIYPLADSEPSPPPTPSVPSVFAFPTAAAKSE